MSETTVKTIGLIYFSLSTGGIQRGASFLIPQFVAWGYKVVILTVVDPTPEEYDAHTRRVIEAKPHFIIDDGGDLVTLIHNDYPELLPNVIGGCEWTGRTL